MNSPLMIGGEDVQLTQRVAMKLHSMHESNQSLRATIAGIRAELAVIQYVNYNLGLLEKAKFRTQYNEKGGDGGFDFEMCGMKWDVKYSRDLVVPIKRIATSTAHIIVVCTGMKHLSRDKILINMLGWAPRQKLVEFLRDNERLIPELFRGFALIKQGFNSHFGFNHEPPKRQIQPWKASELVGDLIEGIEWRYNNNVQRR